MFCYRCGGAMADDSRLCPHCGAPAPLSEPRPGTSEIAPLPATASTVPVAVVPQVAPAPPQTEDKAVISLVLGVLSLVSLSIFAGIPAIILGKMSRANIRASSGRLTGEGMATAGMVMGWVSVGLAGVFVLIILAMVVYLAPGSH